jgi:glycosyltransferase involved in cell wall biosynthesis
VKLIGGPATVTTIHEFIDVDTVYRGKIRRYFMHLYYKMIYLSLAMLNDTIIVHTHDTIRLLSQYSRNGQIKIVPLASISNPVFLPIEDCKRKLGKVSVYTFSYERPPVDGIEVRLLGKRNGHGIDTNLQALLGTFRLARELAKFELLLIVNPDMGSMPAYHLANRYNPKLKVMWTFHGMTPAPYMSVRKDRWLMRARRMASIRSMRRSGLIHVFSHSMKNEVARWGVDPSKVVVMPLGADLGRMASGNGRRVREKYSIGDRFLLLYVGRLVNFKHVDELIRAVSKVDGVALAVVGGGPERDNLEKLVAELHAEERVKFAGVVPDGELPGYYAACDAWATASRHEGFCVPVIEAVAAGKPSIVPELAAMPETAENAGMTYRSGDVEELAEKIKTLSEDRALYERLAASAKASAPSFEMSAVMERYVRMVEEFYRTRPS